MHMSIPYQVSVLFLYVQLWPVSRYECYAHRIYINNKTATVDVCFSGSL